MIDLSISDLNNQPLYDGARVWYVTRLQCGLVPAVIKKITVTKSKVSKYWIKGNEEVPRKVECWEIHTQGGKFFNQTERARKFNCILASADCELQNTFIQIESKI